MADLGPSVLWIRYYWEDECGQGVMVWRWVNFVQGQGLA